MTQEGERASESLKLYWRLVEMEASGTPFCRSHKQPLPCEPCVRQQARLRAQWQDPVFRAGRMAAIKAANTGHRWLAAEDLLLRELAGYRSAAQIAAEFKRRGYVRTQAALYVRATKHLRIDLFGGSGTTAAVAKRLGRRGILVELNPTYCELAVERVGIGMPDRPVEITTKAGESWKQPTLDLAGVEVA